MLAASERSVSALTAIFVCLGAGLMNIVYPTGACYAEAAASREASAEKERDDKVLRHAVFFKFKQSSSEDDVQRIVDAFGALPSRVEAIEAYKWGKNISDSRFSGEFTHCFLITFKDEAGRDAYLPHPAHKEFVSMLRPHLDGAFVIDYWGKPQTTSVEKELLHAVFFKFKDSASEQDVRAVENALAELPARIDAIQAFEWGRNNSPEGLNDGFTHCFMFTFASEDGLKQYSDDPAHQAAVDILRPKVEQIRVFDFWAEGAPRRNR